jgi:hypothetical protein
MPNKTQRPEPLEVQSFIMAPAVGIEPTDFAYSVKELRDILSLIDSLDGRQLLKVVEKWPTLKGPLKLAILAIIAAG